MALWGLPTYDAARIALRAFGPVLAAFISLIAIFVGAVLISSGDTGLVVFLVCVLGLLWLLLMIILVFFSGAMQGGLFHEPRGITREAMLAEWTIEFLATAGFMFVVFGIFASIAAPGPYTGAFLPLGIGVLWLAQIGYQGYFSRDENPEHASTEPER
jgi:hypothetical protein